MTDFTYRSDNLSHRQKDRIIDFRDHENGGKAYLQQPGNAFGGFDWWLFSKLDETLDGIRIPYYNPDRGDFAGWFYPDFVFWLQRGDDYHILFVDPKGAEHAAYERKVDGYRALFEEGGKPRILPDDGLNVRVHVCLRTEDKSKLSEGYARYWFDDIGSMLATLK